MTEATMRSIRGLLVGTLVACGSTENHCPDGMVTIEGSAYRIGVDDPTEPWHETSRTIELDTYCIDIYEYPNTEGQLPRSNVTWEEARDLCEQAGKRLCRSDEWERACRGEARTRYAYGDTRDPAACNTPIEGGALGGNPPLEPAGSHPECVSAEGVRDLNGSVSEWVIGEWDGPAPDGSTADPDEWQLLRGGTMWSQTGYGQDCTSRHAHEGDTYRNIDDGFRCCADPN